MNQQQWAAALLQRLKVPQTPESMRAIIGWAKAEGGHWNNSARYNPLNTTQPEPGAGNTGTQGNIKVYKSWDQGLNATVQTLENGRYGNILSALKAGNASAVGQAIERSPWGTGGLAAKVIGATPAVRATPAPRIPQASYGSPTGLSPVADTRRQIALSLLGFGNLVGSGYTGGSDQLTTTLLQAAQNAQASPKNAAPRVANSAPAPSPGSLAPQVEKALAFARANGWKGQVTSGYRTYAQQKSLYQRYLAGGNIAAKPGQSNHESGQAVDVTDIPGFLRAMAKAPAGVRLYSRVPGDPVHFSVTGH